MFVILSPDAIISLFSFLIFLIFIEYGNPEINNDYTQGKIFGSVKCVENDTGFDYYLFTVNEKGTIDCLDFKERLENYPKGVVKVDAFIHCILRKINKNDKNIRNKVISPLRYGIIFLLKIREGNGSCYSSN